MWVQLLYQLQPRQVVQGAALVKIFLVQAPVQTAVVQFISQPRAITPDVVVSDKRKVLRTSHRVAGPGVVNATSEVGKAWSGAGPGSEIGAARTEKRPKRSGPLDVAAREKSAGVVERNDGSRGRPIVLIMIMKRRGSMQET